MPCPRWTRCRARVREPQAMERHGSRHRAGRILSGAGGAADQTPGGAGVGGAQDAEAVIRIGGVVRLAASDQYDVAVAGLERDGANRERRLAVGERSPRCRRGADSVAVAGARGAHRVGGLPHAAGCAADVHRVAGSVALIHRYRGDAPHGGAVVLLLEVVEGGGGGWGWAEEIPRRTAGRRRHEQRPGRSCGFAGCALGGPGPRESLQAAIIQLLVVGTVKLLGAGLAVHHAPAHEPVGALLGTVALAFSGIFRGHFGALREGGRTKQQ